MAFLRIHSDNLACFRNFLKFLAAWRREITGEAAYRRYRAHGARHHPGQPALSREAFFKAEQDRKWKGLRRCC